ncbi:Beta-mannosyltransferase 1 [Sorochytrium milnesiophthora]
MADSSNSLSKQLARLPQELVDIIAVFAGPEACVATRNPTLLRQLLAGYKSSSNYSTAYERRLLTALLDDRWSDGLRMFIDLDVRDELNVALKQWCWDKVTLPVASLKKLSIPAPPSFYVHSNFASAVLYSIVTMKDHQRRLGSRRKLLRNLSLLALIVLLLRFSGLLVPSSVLEAFDRLPFGSRALVCTAQNATKRIHVIGSLPLNVNVTHFSSAFRDAFDFAHVPDNWVGFSGSGVWIDSQQVYLTTTRMVYKKADCPNPCDALIQSFVYLRALDEHFRPTSMRYQIDDFTVVGVPEDGRIVRVYDATPRDRELGPEDARAHSDDRGNIVLTFNMLDAGGRRFWKYNLTDGELVHLRPDTEQDTIQKNWAPFFIDNMMHFVYNFNPLRVLRCENHNSHCKFVVGNKASAVSSLRGGTPFRRYRDTDYFVGIPRTAQDCSCGRFYRPHVAVLHAPRVNSSTTAVDYARMDLVYVSEPIDFDRVPLRPPYVNGTGNEVCKSLLLPCGFLRWDLGFLGGADQALFELSVNDTMNVVVKVQGLERLVQDAIADDVSRRYSLIDADQPWYPAAPMQVACAERHMDAMCDANRKHIFHS